MLMIKILLIFAILVGITMWGFSLTMEPLKNQEEYESKYSEMGSGDSEKFFSLRTDHLTGKYRIADIGLALSTLGFLTLLAYIFGNRLKSPPYRLLTLAVGIVAVGLTVFAELFALSLNFKRGEFPWWADSLAIPMTGIIAICLILILWVFIHSIFMTSKYSNLDKISYAVSKSINPWLAFVSIATLLVIILYAYSGSALHVTAGFVWLYFYLSLAAGRIAAFNNSSDR